MSQAMSSCRSWPPTPSGRNARDRVADAEGRLERDLIGRVGEAGEAASVDHDAVGERQPLGTVVELDPTRPGRAARQQDWCTEREERPECRRCRPPTQLRATPGKDEQSPCHSDRHDCRSCELRGASAHRQQLRDDDHRRKARREQQRRPECSRRPSLAPQGHNRARAPPGQGGTPPRPSATRSQRVDPAREGLSVPTGPVTASSSGPKPSRDQGTGWRSPEVATVRDFGGEGSYTSPWYATPGNAKWTLCG